MAIEGIHVRFVWFANIAGFKIHGMLVMISDKKNATQDPLDGFIIR